ncbi:unnamed protein product [Brachionus calyciflorus]|uniref:Uncharacterized protein n=1 Tax=Brachionus calyciflorus TaxID=104777 RepID=A0A814ADS0_9BILA|nr:unnamed protein product [Brachionus calyciflorus]
MSILDNNVSKYVKMLACLAFVPKEDVIDGFTVLEITYPEKLKQIFKYFEENYKGAKGRGRNSGRKKPRFDIEIWNCYKRSKHNIPDKLIFFFS